MSFGAPVRNGIGIGLKASTSLSTRGGASAAPPGQQAFTTAGTFSWVAPAGVTSVCVVTVGGGGGGGGGGGLMYRNDIPVIPGTSYTVTVGAGGTANSSAGTPDGGTGGTSSFAGAALPVQASGGSATTGGLRGYTGAGTGGGTGGSAPGGYNGGGAAGYSGNGGNTFIAGFTAGAGGGGAGGAWPYIAGGGVGLLGEGASGTSGGQGGSGGASGIEYGVGALYGGGGSGYDNNINVGRAGGGGAVRIIWGAGRAFPSTNTGNL